MKSIPLVLTTAFLAAAQIPVVAPNGVQRPGAPLFEGQAGIVSSQTGAFSSRTDFIPGSAPQPSAFDCAADGSVVNSVTGEPIVRAHVNIIAAGNAYSTSTDSSGRWMLSGLACTRAQLQVTRPGFLQNTFAGPGRPGSIRGISLASGSPAHDLKTELVPQSVAYGKVQDDQGDPVMGAEVTILAARVADGRLRFQRAGGMMTNDLGEYRIANLPHGKYIVCARQNEPNGLFQATSQTVAIDTCYPGPPEGGASSAMDLPAGRETKVDFTLDQVQAVHVRGTVSGLPEGRGIGLNLIRRDVNSDFGGTLRGAVRGDKFDFRVPPGSYMLTADYFETGKRLTARVPIDVGNADVDNVEVHLDSGFTVTGVVRMMSQSGQTSPRQFGISIRPSEPVNGTGQLKWNPDFTSFAINQMVPGSYRLDIFPPSPFYVKSATLNGQDILSTDVPISQATGPIEIVLRDDGGSIEGDVVDSSGHPVMAGVMLVRNLTRVASLTSQPNGHFQLQNVAPGDYTIYAWDDMNNVEYADADWMRRYGGGGLPITVTAGQKEQVNLTEQMVPQ